MNLEYKDCIIFDLEATCEDKAVNPHFDNECIEIGAVKIIDGKIVSEFQTFIKPQFTQVNKFCTSLTSIKGIDVKDAPVFKEAVNEFKCFVGDLPLLSWGFYDRKQLEKDCGRYDLDTSWLINHRSLKHEFGDFVRAEVEEKVSNGISVPNWLIKKSKKGWGVPSALKLKGLSFDGVHHRGIDDAHNIAKIYLSLFK